MALPESTRGIASARARLALAGGLAVVVAAAVYAVGRVHTPDYTMGLLGRHGSGAIRLKAQLATVILVLAAAQLGLALWMYRRLPGAGAVPRPVPVLHRLGGATLFLLSLPVAAQCVLAYGVDLSGPRVAAHSLAGCFFYGAFAAKVLIVRSRRLPRWSLPVAGGLLVTLIVVLWYSAALIGWIVGCGLLLLRRLDPGVDDLELVDQSGGSRSNSPSRSSTSAWRRSDAGHQPASVIPRAVGTAAQGSAGDRAEPEQVDRLSHQVK